MHVGTQIFGHLNSRHGLHSLGIIREKRVLPSAHTWVVKEVDLIVCNSHALLKSFNTAEVHKLADRLKQQHLSRNKKREDCIPCAVRNVQTMTDVTAAHHRLKVG